LAGLLSAAPAAADTLHRSDAGALYGPAIARPVAPARVCAATAPVCVHGAHAAELATARAALVEAFGAVVDGVGMPAPLGDTSDGGDSRFDLYVVETLPPDADAYAGVAIGREPLDLLSDRDARPAFLLVESKALGGGRCPLAGALAWGVAEASAAGVDAAETRVVVDGMSRYVAEVASGCAADRAAHVAFQRAPWRAIAASTEGPRAWTEWLDRTRGKGVGALVPGLESLATQHWGVSIDLPGAEYPEPAHLRNAIDVSDVLSETMKQQRSTLDALQLEFAVERAFDPIERPPIEWTVPASTLPRRLLVARGVEPTGATYVKLDLDDKTRADGLEIELKWELGASFRWAVIELDAQGARIGEVPVTAMERLREIAIDVRHLERVASVLVVGWNAGDPARPWTPDAPLTLPHGYEIAIYAGAP
jgi:hypothetical protein